MNADLFVTFPERDKEKDAMYSAAGISNASDKEPYQKGKEIGEIVEKGK